MADGTVHSLWTALVLAGALLSIAVAADGARRQRLLRRRVATTLDADRHPGGNIGSRARWRDRWSGRGRSAPLRNWSALASAALAGAVVFGGPFGSLLGLSGAYGVGRWRSRRRARTDLEGGSNPPPVPQLSLAADLLAACLAAGAGPGEAADAVGRSLPGTLGERLARTAAELRLGGEPAHAWGRLGELPGVGPLARCLERSSTTGAPVVEAVSRLAADCRADQDREAMARAGRAQSLATVPLGLCFLPAFLLIGVAPMVIGLASGLRSGM